MQEKPPSNFFKKEIKTLTFTFDGRNGTDGGN